MKYESLSKTKEKKKKKKRKNEWVGASSRDGLRIFVQFTLIQLQVNIKSRNL